MRTLLIVVSTALAVAGVAAGQQHESHRAADRPARLMDSLGRLDHPIVTRSREAQQFFNQGLTFVYAFNHDEAVRSFRRAAELDPASPMPHWGIALALGPNINLDVDPEREKAAYAEAQRARALAAKAPPHEQAYVDAIVKRYSDQPDADLKALAIVYKDAMRDVVRRFPDDLDAATLYAESLMNLNPWQLWSHDGTAAEGTEEIVAVLESVLRRDPSHIGANHYYIHAVEASRTPGRALDSAHRLDTLVPAAGHLVHMPAHVYMRTGNYAGAVKSNRLAAGVDERYITAHDVKGMYPLMYYDHNLHFLAMAAAMAGDSKSAREASLKLVEDATPAVRAMPMGEFYLPSALYVSLRFQRWDEVLRYPEPEAAFRTTRALWRYARGIAYAARRDAKSADAERTAFSGERDQVPADAAFNLNLSRDVLTVASFVLDARIASAGGDTAGALEAWGKAVDAQDRLAYDEPPIWYYPVRESLGGELLRAGRAREAADVFRADLLKNPGNGRSLFGLWKSLEGMKKTRDAQKTRLDFESAWKGADVALRVDDL